MTNIKKISQASSFIYVLLVFCVYVMVSRTLHIITCTRGNSFGSQMIFRNFNFIGFIDRDLLLFQVCSNEGPCSFSTGDNSKKYMYIDNIFIFFPPEPLGQFQPNLCKASLSTFMDEQNSSLNK